MSDRAEGDDRVVTAESERVADCEQFAVRQSTWFGDDVEWDVWILLRQIDRRGSEAVTQCEHGEQCLDGARTAEQVTGRSLGRRYRNLVESVSEGAAERVIFGDVADRGAGRVRVDVCDVIDRGAGELEGGEH